jgi:DNA processing protein
MNTIDIMTILFLPGVGRAKTLKIIKNWSNTDDISAVISKVFKSNIPSEIINTARNSADKLMRDSLHLGIDVIGYNDTNFPHQLKMIKDPPVLLYTKGDLQLLTNDNNIAVIGTREPTKLGKSIAFRFGEILSKKGYCIVSGLALGCDSEAHKGCLSNNGKTIAVMPCGLDNIYPSSNKELYENILNNRGLLISEYPINSRIQKSYFVERDRLQSGLSKGVIVVECKENSGTMHTAKYCIEQNRTLGCFYSKRTPDMSGNILLCSEGAIAINTSEHINYYLEVLELNYKYLIESNALR